MKIKLMLLAVVALMLGGCADGINGIKLDALSSCGECVSDLNAALSATSEQKQVEDMFKNMGVNMPVED